jgi:hypothetical protein
VKPRFFKTAAEFRAWLDKNHDRASELYVGLRKKHSRKPSVTYTEAVEEALCFGWIDGVTRRVDDDSYAIRFTPRRRGSAWSKINVQRVEELTKRRRMKPAGRTAFEARDPAKPGYSYEGRAQEAQPRLRAGAPGHAEGVGVLHGPAARVPARRELLGDERQEGGDAAPAAGEADRGVRGRATAPDVTHVSRGGPCPGRARR